MKTKFSHIDNDGKARMVHIGEKKIIYRKAIAEGKIFLHEKTIKLVRQNLIQKGDVLSVAKIAGIQAAKKTSDLIPLCHSLTLDVVDIDFCIDANSILATSQVECESKTGVEMEAIIAVQIALTTIYDMCKAVDKEMYIGGVKLKEKIKTEK
jgi:cyclic pyranopterin phosphate synthase